MRYLFAGHRPQGSPWPRSCVYLLNTSSPAQIMLRFPTVKPPMSTRRRLALSFVFLWFVIGGVCHFLLTPSFIRIVPPYVPFPLAAVFVSGVFELLGAAGLTMERSRHMAGIGLT